MTRIDGSYEGIGEIRELYDGSFPDDERIPFDILLRNLNEDMSMWAVLDGDRIVGMDVLMRDEDIVYLAYICVKEEERGRGYGSKILDEIAKQNEGKRIVADIEEVRESDPSFGLQKRRRNFYLRNGYGPTGVFYHFFNVDYEIVSHGGTITRDDWQHLIEKHWGKRAEDATYH